MDISIIKGKIKLKGKQASCEVGEGVVITRPDNTNFVIDGFGEFEAGGISIVASLGVTVVEIEGLRICVLEGAAENLPTDSIDITVSANLELAKKTDPWVVITTGAEGAPKYSISKDKLPSDLQVVVLSSKE